MNWKLFIARRIYKKNEGGREVSKPAVRIAMLGIAIGLAIMIVSIAVVIGFKHQVRDKVVGIGSDIVISNFEAQNTYETSPIVANDSLFAQLQTLEGVRHLQRYSTKPGMIMTDTDFEGMVLKGISTEYDLSFIKRHLIEGEIPLFTDTVASQQVLISQTNALKLKLKVGDKIYTYFVDDDHIRARRLTIAGIYQTNFTAYDELFLISDLYTVNRLNNWKTDQVSGVEIQVKDYDKLEDVRELVHEKVEVQTDKYGGIYFTQSIEDLHPEIFAWLGLLDMNVWVILILMIGVAGFLPSLISKYL